MYQLRIELCQPWLSGIVEDQHGVDHGCYGVRRNCGSRLNVIEAMTYSYLFYAGSSTLLESPWP
jgi:hypothetical protein